MKCCRHTQKQDLGACSLPQYRDTISQDGDKHMSSVIIPLSRRDRVDGADAQPFAKTWEGTGDLQACMLLQENGSEAGSPPRERDSVYEAETEPSAGDSSALIDDADEATQRRPTAGAGGTVLCAFSPQPSSVPHMAGFAACAGLF